MRLKSIELSGFKSFAKKTTLEFASAITSIVGPNGSGKSNTAEAFRFVLGEQSMKSMRGKRGEDLIWNGGASAPRAGRAGVKLIFDNSDRALNLDFDEVMIERVVYRDGGNDYLLNGSVVRLRDIAELLAQANIGASAHHIISQGEADRILSASSRERREMIEDALGLTAYLYKREEAEKKLEKTAENVREVEALRRELIPHLKFLSAQVKKIEEAEALRDELKEKYKEYLKRESVYLRVAEAELKQELSVPKQERAALDHRIEHLKHGLDGKGKKDASTHELIVLEGEGRRISSRREAAGRELGRIEGELTAHERIVQVHEGSVPAAEANTFAHRVQEELEAILNLNGQELKARLSALIILARDFIRRVKERSSPQEIDTEALKHKKMQLERELGELTKEETRVAKSVEELRLSIESEKDASREAERELFQAMAARSALETQLAMLRAREELLVREQAAFKAELGEAGVLIGREVLEYEETVIRDAAGIVSEADMTQEDRARQEERRKKLERTKIKLEEIGAGNSAEVLKEHRETTERDEFLLRELSDLSVSSQKLHELIGELTKTLEVRFVNGIEKINAEFENFFKLMFGGGTANLSIVREKRLRRVAPQDMLADIADNVSDRDEDDDEEIEEGVDITIALPHKRTKGLHMLSGGERALTSIALIFAMSQVNPPPFLILDETDAALDEANSKRYGDMIESLSRKSQLILITHNRETMSRAGILYGVTMGQDGISKLLSVKFEDALAVAK